MFLDVKPEHIDELNHVNNVVYVQWIQDVAAKHWFNASTEEMKRQCTWVVMRHEIDYLAEAFLGDHLELFTWIDPATGPMQQRMVLIQRKSDQKAIAKATTSWCLLDPVTGKPKRISPEISAAMGLKE